MMIKGMFDVDFRLEKIDRNGDPLVGIKMICEILQPMAKSIKLSGWSMYILNLNGNQRHQI